MARPATKSRCRFLKMSNFRLPSNSCRNRCTMSRTSTPHRFMPLESSSSEAFRSEYDRATGAAPRSRARGFSGRNEPVAQHDLFQPRRIRLPGTARSLRDLLVISPADRPRVSDGAGAGRLVMHVFAVMDCAAGNSQAVAGADFMRLAVD